jgi:hypothetical protein
MAIVSKVASPEIVEFDVLSIARAAVILAPKGTMKSVRQDLRSILPLSKIGAACGHVGSTATVRVHCRFAVSAALVT